MLDELLPKQPTSPQVQEHMALAERKAGNTGAARAWYRCSAQGYEEALAVTVGTTSAASARAWYRRSAQTYEEAALAVWALLEAKAGQVDRMRALFRLTLSPNPKSIPTLHAWACQEARLATTESRETSRGLFVKCLEVQHGCVRALQAWGGMEHAAGDVEAARRLFDRCLEAAPHSVPTLEAYACLERQQGNLAKAHSLLSLALSAQLGNAASL
ncbi:unnamed protein product [Closterium sp. NIES-65]|nr:unnamed protein product [Closterium sp. NIES-65]